jgi:hypothetical protein
MFTNPSHKKRMKLKLYILPAFTSAFLIVAGCQTDTHQPPTSSLTSASTTTPAAAPATAANAPTPPAPEASFAANKLAFPIRINAGATASVKDATGVEWLGDTGFSGGDVTERPDQQIANTTQPEIYRSEHYSMDSFTQKLPNGKYQVKLHFCETYDSITEPGQRVFTFELGGKTFKDFDVFAKAGGFAKAYVETVPVEINHGQLDIKFTPQTENPQINAIEIIPIP